MISRVRIEATGESDLVVRNDLAAGLSALTENFEGDWEPEEPGLQVQTTRDGFWGRLTVRRELGT